MKITIEVLDSPAVWQVRVQDILGGEDQMLRQGFTPDHAQKEEILAQGLRDASWVANTFVTRYLANSLTKNNLLQGSVT